MSDAEKEIKGRAKGGKAAASKLTPQERSERAKNAAAKRWAKKPEQVPDVKVGVSSGLNLAREKAREKNIVAIPKFAPPIIAPGVVPKGKSPAIAMDYNPGAYEYMNQFGAPFSPFPGYPYLSNLATRAEYRAFADVLSSELTREWIKFTGKTDKDGDHDNEEDKLRIPQLEEAIKRFDLKRVFKTAAMHDCFFGRGQISINIDGAEESIPLILSPKTIKKGSLRGFTAVEAIWTTPSAYNSIDPTAPDFYRPREWFMLGRQIHASRLLTIITRPLPDILKPAYNFSGMSISQLAEPYVNNWLRTRQSISDLINFFSTTILKTNMAQALQGECDGSDMFARADLFTLMRTNRGLMVVDKDTEELDQINTPLSGLHELQAQSQEHLSSVSRIPTMIYTGISPTGMNASSEGEIRVFYDWIASQQESYYRHPLETCIKAIMLDLWGEIDESITFEFNSLWQVSAKEESDIRVNNANAAATYMDRGVLSAEEVRENLASDPCSGYSGINVAELPEMPDDDPYASDPLLNPLGATDKSVSEKQHRAMEAAASGHSTLGIPEKVGKEFVEKDKEK